jgi:hypothetical protein
MVGQLKVDMDQLERIRLKLSQVTNLLAGDDTFSAEAADFVGNDHLAQRVRDFGTSWDDRRVKLVARLDRIEDAVGKIGSSFSNVETELKNALGGSAPTPVTSTVGAGSSSEGGRGGRGR